MDRKQDRENIVAEIKRAAEAYKNELIGKKFMYVFDGRYIEVIYKAENFKHLTGVESSLSAKTFYNSASKKQLQEKQICFSSKHPFQLCKRKIKHLAEIASLAGAESFMLEEIITTTRTFKFGTTNLDFTLCLNRPKDENGKETSDCYIVESLRDEDCFTKSKTAFVVTHIFAKKNTEKEYSELLHLDSSATLEALPENIKKLLSKKFLQK